MEAYETDNSYIESLRRFLAGTDDPDVLQEALVEAEWDPELDQGLKDALARIRLFLCEASEGFRPFEELRFEIVRLLASLAAVGTPSSPTTRADLDLVRQVRISGTLYSWDSSDRTASEGVVGRLERGEVAIFVEADNREATPTTGLDEVQIISQPVPA